jgi:hypothetical protein
MPALRRAPSALLQACSRLCAGRGGAVYTPELFDLTPTRGTLAPGQSEDVEIFFRAKANVRGTVTVVCEVSGGPEYEVVIRGEAASASYKILTSFIDFGEVELGQSLTREVRGDAELPAVRFASSTFAVQVVLSNTGKIALPFSIDTFCKQSPAPFVVTPASGTVPVNQKQVISVRAAPALPGYVTAELQVRLAARHAGRVESHSSSLSVQFRVAHLPVESVALEMDAFSAQVALSLQRKEDEQWARALEEAKALVANARRMVGSARAAGRGRHVAQALIAGSDA